jgi:hypothetical protein
MIKDHNTLTEVRRTLIDGAIGVSSNDAVAKTIDTAAISDVVGGLLYTVDTEAAAASDTLSTITFKSDLPDTSKVGAVIFIEQADSARDIILDKAGNIDFGAATSITLGLVGQIACLLWVKDKWRVISHTGTEV